ncbi:iron-siderophore ABC transporter substrate-binding protein [Bacillus sp. JCM 19041]|uniref:ABC transporter substrate-binding protein n=1 Tax=Bacillus sp. JCM 19041 TaxID=1460637 RepID=UPI0006D11086
MCLNLKKDRGFLSLVLLALILGACSNSSDQEENGEATLNQDNELTDQTDGETIEHLQGEFVLESVPERIVVLDVQYLDHMLALGERPVGTVYAETDNGLPDYLGDEPGEVTLLGTYLEPDLEETLSLEPDLIIATDAHQEIYNQLESIAPTIMFDRMEDWQSVLLSFGMILNHPDEADELIKGYNEKVNELTLSLADTVGEETAALIRPRDDMIRLHTTAHRTAQILYDDLGLTPPEMAETSSDTSAMISLEVMPELEADHLFLLQDDTNEELTASFQETSIWQGLSAVQSDQVYDKNTALWIGYYAPIAIDLVIDQIAEELN